MTLTARIGGRRFRQIHLDFHTSEHLPGIGTAFVRRAWQRTLREAAVDSVTCFSKCHHGWSYHPTTVGEMHPHLGFDLLRAQMDACHEIDVAVPIYFSGGIDNRASAAHPEWREIDAEGRLMGWAKSPVEPGFHKLCLHSPYLDLLERQVVEAVTAFPDNDGVFIDIIYPTGCACGYCRAVMRRSALDPADAADRMRCSVLGIERYLTRITAAARSRRADTPVFHNSSVLRRGWRRYLPSFSHVELESLPTGGWGYDHFPLGAAYFRRLGLPVVGMTGKFHTTWGEFGGYKHPDALRYECAAMLALGARCSVGDQLHPDGALDPSTFAAIGTAYREVRDKEPWVEGAVPVADIGLLSVVACRPEDGPEHDADTGAVRVLQEGHFLYDLIDRETDFAPYRLLILPDAVPVDAALAARLEGYIAAGGRLLLSAASGTQLVRGAVVGEPSPWCPDYLMATGNLQPDFCASPLVMGLPSRRLTVTNGLPLGNVHDPYFNRTWEHFSSHQHAPPRRDSSGFASGVSHEGVTYAAHPLFSLYRGSGAVALRQHLIKLIRFALGSRPSVEAMLPSTARIALHRQPGRDVLHLLYGPTATRGGPMALHGGMVAAQTKAVEVIDELPSLYAVRCSVRTAREIARVTCEPGGEELPFTTLDGTISIVVPAFTCHQLVVFHHRT